MTLQSLVSCILAVGCSHCHAISLARQAGLSLVSRIPLRVTIGAYVGGLLAVAVPYGAIWYSTLNYQGGGANIGLGLLLMATLVLLPIPMLIGGFVGWVVPTRPKSLLK